MIEEATGVPSHDHENLDEVEILFSPLTQIADENSGLARCTRLRELALIDCGLESIGSLEAVSGTLERLCLCDQKQLTSMRGLGRMPQLRWLYLQQNAIERIDDLQGCPRLRTLWLFRNKIAKLENLHDLGELRELWVQSNRLTRIQGLDDLVALKDLQLSGNPITDYRDLPRLARLPSLETVSFRDAHFMPHCPVSDRDGYRTAMLRALRHVQIFDGQPITKTDRSKAKESFLEEVLHFNEKVDAVVRERRKEAADVEARRRKSRARAEDIDDQMRDNFADLDAVLRNGKLAVKEDHDRRRMARASCLGALDAALTAAFAAHAARQANFDEIDAQNAKKQDDLLDAIERRARADRYLAGVVAKLRRKSSSLVLLGEHSPDFKWLGAHLQQKDDDDERALRVCRAYRISPQPLKKVPGPTSSSLGFFCASASWTLDADVRLHSNARAAVDAAFPSSSTPPRVGPETEDTNDDGLAALREARRCLMVSEVSDDDDVSLDKEVFRRDDVAGDLAIVAVYRDKLPEYLVLVASRMAARDPKSLEADLAAISTDLPSLDEDLDELVKNLLDHHRHCAQADLDPVTADRLRDADSDLANKENRLKQHRANVDEHRKAQDAILHDFYKHRGFASSSENKGGGPYPPVTRSGSASSLRSSGASSTNTLGPASRGPSSSEVLHYHPDDHPLASLSSVPPPIDRRVR